MTDGPEDLVYTLRRECLLKGIRLAAYFDRFFDLCKEFNRFYPEYGAKSLADMAQCMGVARKADSSCMENCKIISNIVASVLREGYAFVEPEVIRVTFGPFAVAAQQPALPAAAEQPRPTLHLPHPPHAPAFAGTALGASSVNAISSSSGGGAARVALSYKGPAATAAAGLSPQSVEHEPRVVRLRGLPWDAKDEDVRWAARAWRSVSLTRVPRSCTCFSTGWWWWKCCGRSRTATVHQGKRM